MVKFFMFLLPGSEKKMRIPVKFARLLTSVNKVSISSCLGKMWHVELSRDETNTYFKKGWPEFLKAHKIQLGYFMVFSYEAQSNFSIEIFDQTFCLKVYNGSAYSKIDAQRDLQVPEGRQADDVSHDGSNSDNSYTGFVDETSEYIKEENDSESSYSSSEDHDFSDTEFTVPDTTRVNYQENRKGKKAAIPSNLDKKTQNSNKQNRGVNKRGKRSKLMKNVNSSALSVSGSNKKNRGVIAINKDYNLRYMPLRKGFCDDSQYELTEGMATVRNERLEAYCVKYKVCGNYNNLGKGWSKFCEANGVRLGDRCLIKIIGDNEFLVKIKRHYQHTCQRRQTYILESTENFLGDQTNTRNQHTEGPTVLDYAGDALSKDLFILVS